MCVRVCVLQSGGSCPVLRGRAAKKQNFYELWLEYSVHLVDRGSSPPIIPLRISSSMRMRRNFWPKKVWSYPVSCLCPRYSLWFKCLKCSLTQLFTPLVRVSVSTLGLAGRANSEEDPAEDTEQTIRPREPEEEEGLCGQSGRKVRATCSSVHAPDGHLVSDRHLPSQQTDGGSDQMFGFSSRKRSCSCLDFKTS